MTLPTQRFFVLSPIGAAQGRLREAEQYFLLGNLNEALAAAQQAWREHPQEGDVFRVLSYLHMARGEFPPAVQAARQAVVVDGENPQSYAILAQVYLTFGVYKLAREVLTQARERFPADHAFTALLADLCFRQRQLLQAVELAQAVLAANPQDGYMKALLGQYYCSHRRYAQALTYLTGAVEAYPQRADYLRDLGIAQLHQQQPTEAARSLARSMLLNPNDHATKRYLCYAIRVQGQSSWYWNTSWFFYEHLALGWILILCGFAALLTGAIWLPIALTNAWSDWQGMTVPAGLLLAGIVAVVFTWSGLSMASRRGERFDSFLHGIVDQQRLVEKMETPA